MIQELNPAKLALLYRREFEMCQVKKGETIVAVSDLATGASTCRRRSPRPTTSARTSTSCA